MYDTCLPVVFGEYFKHSEISSSLKPTSAGFFVEKDGEIIVGGDSMSLGLKSHPNDAHWIKRMLEQK